QSYVIALEPLREFGVEQIRVHSEQAISGAGKTFTTFPEIERNLIPLIKDEERKSEVEPLKIWRRVSGDGIVPAHNPPSTAKCLRVGALHGHTAYVAVKLKTIPTDRQILDRGARCKAPDRLPSTPVKVIHYRSEPD